jgi:hypothetical protein
MGQTNVLVLSIRPHKAVIEAKRAQIITNLFEPPYLETTTTIRKGLKW